MVGEIEVVFSSSVIQYLDNLVIVLYKKEYFGFVESAEEYVSNIYDAVPEHIKKTTNKKTPDKLQYLGSNYIFYREPMQEQRGMSFLKKEDKII